MTKSKEPLRDFGVWPIADDTVFPTGFFDIGDKTFLEVYNTRKEFVDFIKLVDDATGLFGSFQTYCLGRD
jgi:hypothetical protein